MAEFVRWKPGMSIDDVTQAVDHYVNWLGFSLDFEWRASPGEPAILFLSRDGLLLTLAETSALGPPTMLRGEVSNLEQLVADWNTHSQKNVEIIREEPYEIPVVYIVDPAGNTLVLEQQRDEDADQEREATIARAVAHLRGMDDLPSAPSLADELKISRGIAVDALAAYAKEMGESGL